MKLLTTKNYKIMKGAKLGYSSAILHLAPFTLSGKNVCPKASQGCAAACLNTSGHGRYAMVQNARKNRTLRFFNERENFESDLKTDIETVIRRAKKNNQIPAIRINGTSDLPALAIKFAKMFPKIHFYDYTKIAKTFDKELPKNYHLTFSRSETNENEALNLLERGFNVAVVFNKLPKTYKGFEVINGDDTDLRFLDKKGKKGKGVIVGLLAKGKGKYDKSGFVVSID